MRPHCLSLSQLPNSNGSVIPLIPSIPGGSVAAREVPAPRYGSTGLSRSFPEPAFPAQAFLGMRSQGCWFGEPARMEGIWGKSVGPLLWLTPSPPARGSKAAPGMGPSHLALHLRPQQREPRASPSACLPRDDASPGIWWKKGGREEVSSQCKAAGAKSEPRKSPAHPSRVKRALCAKVNTGCTCPQAPVRGSTIDGLFLS